MKALSVVLLMFWPMGVFAEDVRRETEYKEVPTETLAVLCADQADRRIRLFAPQSTVEPNAALWCYPGDDEPAHEYIPTDAKRVEWEGVVHILAAYHGRVRLIRFSDQKLIRDFSSYGSCHSAELLPDGAIVSANSNHGKLRLHDSEETFCDLDLPSAHGVTWDKTRNCLWALGDALYRVKYLDHRLVVDQRFDLPVSPTGHDLFPHRDGAKLFVSNNDGLFTFDIATEDFETVSEIKQIKSVSQHADGSVWVSEPQAIDGAAEWQSNAIIAVGDHVGSGRYIRDQSRFYKARWWQQVGFSY